MILLLRYEPCGSEANGWMGDGCCHGLTSVTQNCSLVVIRPGQMKTLSSPQKKLSAFLPILQSLLHWGQMQSAQLCLRQKEAEIIWQLGLSLSAAGGSGGMLLPILVPWRGPVQCQQRFRSWDRILLLLPETLKAAPWLPAQVCLQGLPPKHLFASLVLVNWPCGNQRDAEVNWETLHTLLSGRRALYPWMTRDWACQPEKRLFVHFWE